MKKVLFASTALVLTAGVASAEVTLSGSANMGLKYDGSETIVANEIDIDVKATAETDGGLSLGASLDLDASSSDSSHKQDSTDLDPEVFVSYNGLTLTVGNIGEANDTGGISDLGYDGIGVDDVVDLLREPGSDDVRVDYAFGDIAVALTADSSNSDVAVAISGDLGDFSFSAAFADRELGDVATATVGYSAGAFAVGATYVDGYTTSTSSTFAFAAATGVTETVTTTVTEADAWGVEASYTTGDITISAAFAQRDTAGVKTEGYGIGVAYDLGGATLAAGIGEVSDETVADLGISFGF